MTQNDSLYNRIGGEAAVSAAVDIFYRKVLNDDRIKEFFDDTDMDRQIAKQKSFLTMAFGGPKNYTGKDLRTAHAPLVKRGMGHQHFNAVVELLGETLAQLEVRKDIIKEVTAIAESTRNDVLTG